MLAVAYDPHLDVYVYRMAVCQASVYLYNVQDVTLLDDVAVYTPILDDNAPTPEVPCVRPSGQAVEVKVSL